MTEKLKYKVGDKVLVEAEVMEVDDISTLYQVESEDGGFSMQLPEKYLKALDALLPRPKVTQTVMDYYLANLDKGWDMGEWLDYLNMPDDVEKWAYGSDDFKEGKKNQYALATLIAYGPEAVEVEKEKKYRVRLKNGKNRWGQVQNLVVYDGNYHFSGVEAGRPDFTEQELIEAGFEGVFDNPMFEVEEVE